jgi:hypothetical protein
MYDVRIRFSSAYSCCIFPTTVYSTIPLIYIYIYIIGFSPRIHSWTRIKLNSWCIYTCNVRIHLSFVYSCCIFPTNVNSIISFIYIYMYRTRHACMHPHPTSTHLIMFHDSILEVPIYMHPQLSLCWSYLVWPCTRNVHMLRSQSHNTVFHHRSHESYLLICIMNKPLCGFSDHHTLCLSAWQYLSIQKAWLCTQSAHTFGINNDRSLVCTMHCHHYQLAA